MRRSLLLVPVVLLGLAVLGCATKDDVNKVDVKVTGMNDGLKIWADSITLYVGALHDAVCTLAKKTNTILPDQQRTKCPPGGGGEGTPPPKYPPQ